jgi:hypothetical protein
MPDFGLAMACVTPPRLAPMAFPTMPKLTVPLNSEQLPSCAVLLAFFLLFFSWPFFLFIPLPPLLISLACSGIFVRTLLYSPGIELAGVALFFASILPSHSLYTPRPRIG